MSEEPLFDPSLKKRKKKTVAFSEDPLGADADPTTPAPAEIDNVTASGDAVDMGPTTMHEQMKQNGIKGEGLDDGDKKEDDDFKAMFGDLKKKKKKKEIPLDLVCCVTLCSRSLILSFPLLSGCRRIWHFHPSRRSSLGGSRFLRPQEKEKEIVEEGCSRLRGV